MTAPTFDAARFKAQERAGFNRIAARYAAGAHLRAKLADALLHAAELGAGMQVLDLASGPALLATAAARKVSPDGWVLATDIAESMLAQARDGVPADSGKVESTLLGYAAADAEHLCIADASFDRVLAGLALFMFPHPERALTEIRRVLRPDGKLALSVWGAREHVPLISRAQDCIARILPAPKVARPSVFRFGTEGALESILSDAGFGKVQVQACDFTCDFDDAEHYWQAFLDLAGGAAEALARLPSTTQVELRAAIEADLEPHRKASGPGYTVAARALVAVASTN